MVARDGVLDPEERQLAKQESRDRDAEDLRFGRVSPKEMSRANGFFSALDMREARIAAIGRRECASARHWR